MNTPTRVSYKTRTSSRHNLRSRSTGSIISSSYISRSSSLSHEERALIIPELSKNFSDDPMHYFRKYLNSQVQQPRDFIVLRQAPKPTAFTSTKYSSCSYIPSESVLKINNESGEKIIQVNMLEKIEWGTIEAPSGKMKYINITIKGDRSPLIIHGPTETMDLFFDALRLISNDQPITGTAGTKITYFKKAIEISKINLNQDVEIPPPPTNFDFVSSVSQN